MALMGILSDKRHGYGNLYPGYVVYVRPGEEKHSYKINSSRLLNFMTVKSDRMTRLVVTILLDDKLHCAESLEMLIQTTPRSIPSQVLSFE